MSDSGEKRVVASNSIILSPETLNNQIIPAMPGVWPLLFEGPLREKSVGQYQFYSMVDMRAQQIVLALSNDGYHNSQLPPLKLIFNKLEAVEEFRHSPSSTIDLMRFFARHEGFLLSWNDENDILTMFPYLEVPRKRLLSKLVVRPIDIFNAQRDDVEAVMPATDRYIVIHQKHIIKDRRLILLVICYQEDRLIRFSSDLVYDCEEQQLLHGRKVHVPYITLGKA